ncbi:MAG: hypothetical protein R3231_03120, partial [bacterium]|nr:hypothetical protein [bacterium]
FHDLLSVPSGPFGDRPRAMSLSTRRFSVDAQSKRQRQQQGHSPIFTGVHKGSVSNTMDDGLVILNQR